MSLETKIKVNGEFVFHPFEQVCRSCGSSIIADTGKNMSLPPWAAKKDFFRCRRFPECDTWIACLPGDKRFQVAGWAANTETRKARATLKNYFFDPIWMWKNFTRPENDSTDYKKKTYEWIANKMGLSGFFFGMLSVEDCIKAKELCEVVHRAYPEIVTRRNEVRELVGRLK